MDQALFITHLLVGLLCVVSLVWLVLAVVRGRKRERATFDRGTGKRAWLLPAAIAAFVFLVVDGHLFVSSTRDMHGTFANFESVLADDDVLRLQIAGRQWAWDARYPGADDRFGTPDDIYVTTDIRVPAGRPVVIQLAAVDVVHALYIPNMRVQIDAIPGRIGWTWFQAQETGTFDIACAQHCGVNHYKMSAILHVLDGPAFDQWVAIESRYATKIEAAGSELKGDKPASLYPSFDKDPAIAPRAWGWPWEDGRR